MTIASRRWAVGLVLLGLLLQSSARGGWDISYPFDTQQFDHPVSSVPSMGDGAESSTHDSYFLFHYDDATSSWLLYGYTQRYPYPQNQIQMDANGVWETTAKRFGDTDFHGDESYKLVLMDVPGPDPVSHFTIVYID